MNKNLWEETNEIFMRHGKKFDEVVWIGIIDKLNNVSYKMPREDFIIKSDREYYAGFGLQEVNPNLVVVGKDFWLERHEYDGSEWWEYKSIPVEPEEVSNDINIFER